MQQLPPAGQRPMERLSSEVAAITSLWMFLQPTDRVNLSQTSFYAPSDMRWNIKDLPTFDRDPDFSDDERGGEVPRVAG